jgi:putative SOS response-associated peptidase YedK
MCGRYSLAPSELSQIRLEFQVEAKLELSPRYNIAPTWAAGYEPPIIYQEPAGAWQLALARWWMIPASWQRPLSALPTAFNARAEELGEKPFWSRSFDSRRCLVPATGWREFRGPSGQRQAFQFHFEHALFAFAGIWDSWAAPDGASIRSFAIVTVPANDSVSPIHDRMPLRVDPTFYADWLNPALSGASALASVRGAPDPALSYYESDPRGNNSRLEGPDCIAPRVVRQLGLFG